MTRGSHRGKRPPAPAIHRPFAGLSLIPLPFILLLTWFLYRPSLEHGFTNWDDPVYILENQDLTLPPAESARSFFLHPAASNYHPLTMISLAADYRAAMRGKPAQPQPEGPDAGRFHRTNVLLHLINTLLLYFVILALSRWRWIPAALTALLFAIHPMHVESVAWISERKDVLYALFFLSALLPYLAYAAKPAIWSYALTFVLFAGALLSKPAAVTFPLILLLIDWFTGRRLTLRAWLEKIPFFLAGGAIGLTTFLIQSDIAVADIRTISLFERLLFGSFGLVMYVYKLIIPIQLSAFYPYPSLTATGHLPLVFYFAPAVVLLLALIVYGLARKTRVIVFGSLLFFISLVLVLQLITVGSAIMADRYTYIAAIGLFFIAGWNLDQAFLEKRGWRYRMRWLLAAATILYAVWMVFLARERIGIWKNSETLWTDVIRKYPGTDVAYRNRGNYYGAMDQTEKALADYHVYLQLKKDDPRGYSNLGNIYSLRNETGKALEAYSRSIALDSLNHEAYLNRAITYFKSGQFERALQDYDRAVLLNPGSLQVRQNRAYSYFDMGRYRDAIGEFTILIERMPPSEDFYLKRGVSWYMEKEYRQALDDYRQCMNLNPSGGMAPFNAAIALSEMGDYRQAYQMAIRARALAYPVPENFMEGLKAKQ